MNYKIIDLYDFCLTSNICMLKPIQIDGRNCSLVLETKRRYVVPCSVTRLMNRICTSLGTTLDATLAYSNNIFRELHLNNEKENMIKLPIILSLMDQPYVFFPTASPKKNHNTWVLWQNFRGHSLVSKYAIGLHFKNDIYTEEQISFTTLSRQQYYASILYFRHMDEVLLKQYAEKIHATVQHDLFLVP